MRVIVKLILYAIFISLLSQVAFGATIISPVEGQQVDAGSWITIIIKPDQGEQWENFIAGFKPFEYDPIINVYRLTIQVPNDALGYLDDLRVYGLDKSGNEIWLKRRIVVKLPPNVVLQGISVVEELMVLYTAPSDSSPEDKERIETDQIGVAGLYSDGVKRQITSSGMGTTYINSDEKIVTVDAEGKMTAKGIGRAKITVKNGNYSAIVDVIVKPYKK